MYSCLFSKGGKVIDVASILIKQIEHADFSFPSLLEVFLSAVQAAFEIKSGVNVCFKGIL